MHRALSNSCSLAFMPQPCSMFRAIQEGTSIGALTALDRPGDAYELGFQHFAGDANNGITVAAHVDKRKVRRQIRIQQGSRLLEVSTLHIFKAGTYTVLEQQVHGRLRPHIRRSLPDEKRAQRMILGESMLECFYDPGSRNGCVTNAIPTGSKDLGGRFLAARPAQKLCRSPATVTKPVIPFSRTKS